MSNINCAAKMSLRLFSLRKHGCVNEVKILSRFFGDNSAAQEQNTSEQHGLKKLIKVAVLGTPNAGKSTLINKLCAMPLCPASKKVHTTKSLVRAVCHIENTQVVFLDTPGLLSEKAIKKYKFPQKMVDACAQGKNLSDLVAVLYDASSHHPPALPPEIIPFLRKNHPAILVLNKVDMIKSKRRLLEITRLLAGTTVSKKRGEKTTDLEESVFTENNRGYKNFLEVFLISALKGDGMDTLMKYFVERAIPSQHIHPLAPIDIPPEQFIVETVRAKLLNFLPRELPYIVIPELELFEENSDGSITAAVRLRCPTQRISNVIAGVECGRLFHMQNAAREDITKVFGVPFTLVLQTDPPVTDNRKSHQVPIFDPNVTKLIV